MNEAIVCGDCRSCVGMMSTSDYISSQARCHEEDLSTPRAIIVSGWSANRTLRLGRDSVIRQGPCEEAGLMTICIVESARNTSKVSVVMDLVRNRLHCVSSPNLWLAEPYFLPWLYYLAFFWSPRLMRRPLR